MKRIYLYELKRLLWNKFFIGLLLVTLFYGGQVLQNETLLGVADTAPFSPWSFGAYLGRMLPLLWVGALFFLTFFTGAAQKRVAALTDATPAPPRRYDLARLAAAATGAALLSLAAVAEALFFYARMFAWYGWGALLSPALLALVPPLALALGGGWLLGRARPWLLWLWAALPFLLMALPLPQALSMLNGSFFSAYPASLNALDPAFALPGGVLAAQILLLAAGAAAAVLGAGRRDVRLHA